MCCISESGSIVAATSGSRRPVQYRDQFTGNAIANEYTYATANLMASSMGKAPYGECKT